MSISAGQPPVFNVHSTFCVQLHRLVEERMLTCPTRQSFAFALTGRDLDLELLLGALPQAIVLHPFRVNK